MGGAEVTSPQTAAECMAAISQTAANIRALLEQIEGAADLTVRTEQEFRDAYNDALIKHADNRTDLTKALAERDTKVERAAYEFAKAKERRIKEALHSERSILSGLQTVTTGYREEARFARTGPGY